MKRPQYVAKGSCHGVNLIHRPGNDNHVLVQIFSEDDGTWHSDQTFSSGWLDALIVMLQDVQSDMKRFGVPDGKNARWGYKMASHRVVDKVDQMWEGQD